MERGWGVNILEDARHCSVLYIRKYFVLYILVCVRFSLSESVVLSVSTEPEFLNV